MHNRPFGCENCQEISSISYLQVDRDGDTAYKMCEKCPHLNVFLQYRNARTSIEHTSCARCMTSAESVIQGGKVGCFSCYEHFSSLLEHDATVTDVSKPTEVTDNCAWQGYILEQELQQAVKNEEYEKAALLRDAIAKVQDGLNEK